MNIKERVARLRHHNAGVRVFGTANKEVVVIDFAEVQSITAWRPTPCVVTLKGGADYALTVDTDSFLKAFERGGE
jgi:hypothetical protein